MKDKIYKILPDFMQGILISLYNYLAYKDRYGLKYKEYFELFKKNRHLSLDELQKNQQERFHLFLSDAIKNAPFYKNYPLIRLDQLAQLPIIKKEDLRQHIHQVYTVSKAEGVVSKTGGTTGKSLEVLFTKENTQERFALLDDFRNRFGYQLGKKTAWFSGKDLLTQADVEKHRFWKTDWFYKVRYYSTFHIKEDYLKYYIENLMHYKPEYFVGFPSTILELAKYGLKNGYDFPEGTVKAIFPTAETITLEMRKTIESFFKTKMYNQYASSEGAPFIFECEKGNLHLELQSGVFEVLDEDDRACNSGRLVITSFTTAGTPLIRYDIGDSISLEDAALTCTCGNHNPLVKEILGRVDDYIYSPENGKINLGNVSNTLKDTKGIIRFQVIQNELNKIDVLVIKDDRIYTDVTEKKFLQNWKDRVGNHMIISVKYVSEIPVEKSGKYRLVKNNIKHLI
ncbi:phenylacetate--CoA ligase family protein [Sphingobacterium sp. UDSM-2020]|uniref:phenylacetate--CoA ligase family protein n=1 Tax=Sphingobacterium sp. UDSM-2020 TaxID=2795738 RepID=UPI001937EAF9|nr:phenylacetate--CoA ligase family protein [Sphingobacterium sp. UDSM-2020]QQD15384.1 phenylacetate--CoA ligase family protein [Sphingobacterium sp. UDSM-2020]